MFMMSVRDPRSKKGIYLLFPTWYPYYLPFKKSEAIPYLDFHGHKIPSPIVAVRMSRDIRPSAGGSARMGAVRQ